MRKTPRTLGVLSIVFGSLVAAWNLISLGLQSLSNAFMNNMNAAGMTAQPGQPDMAAMMAKMEAMMKQLAPYVYGMLLAKLVFSIALFIIGFGLYKQRRWGRSGAIGWGVLALLFLGVEIAINVGVIQPRTMSIMQDVFAGMPNAAQMAPMMSAVKGMQGGMTVLFSLLFYAPYPIVLLVLCGRRSAAADFTD